MRRRITGALGFALAVGLGACGAGGGTRTVTVGLTPTPAPATATPAGGAAPASPTPAGDALVEAEGSIDGGRARFVITELRRSGPTVLLNARVELAPAARSGSLQVNTTFGDDRRQRLETGGHEPLDTFDGIALIDPAGRKKYLVARDSTGRCVCSGELGAAFISRGAPVELQATLTAPPPEVKQVDVFVPRFETFRGVAIAE
jgi:hypothetical protein